MVGGYATRWSLPTVYVVAYAEQMCSSFIEETSDNTIIHDIVKKICFDDITRRLLLHIKEKTTVRAILLIPQRRIAIAATANI